MHLHDRAGALASSYIPYSGKVWWGKVWQIDLFEHLTKESLANYRSANRLLLLITNLDSSSLANHGHLPNFPTIRYDQNLRATDTRAYIP